MLIFLNKKNRNKIYNLTIFLKLKKRENNMRKEEHERAQVFGSFDAVIGRRRRAQRLPLSTATTTHATTEHTRLQFILYKNL